MEQILDALMNPIQIGKIYGYSQGRDDGMNTVTIGVAFEEIMLLLATIYLSHWKEMRIETSVEDMYLLVWFFL